MSERIYKNRVYFVSQEQGISGFQRWGMYDWGIASGHTVQLHRRLVANHARPSFGNLNDGQRFRLDNGQMPDHQPRATYLEAGDWVLANPGRIAWIIPQ